MNFLLWMVAVGLIVAGIIGVIVPAIPGTLLVFAGLFVAAAIDGFTKVGWLTILILALLTLASYAVDFIASTLGAKRVGASKLSLIGAMLGMLVGLFFGIPGMVIGPFAGAVIGELIVKRDPVQAGKAGLAAWIGMLVATIVKLGLVFVMLGLFILVYIL